MTISPEDLRAATAAGILDEAQAARLAALANQRAGRLALGLAEDEPFELFKGFAEIFISIGLILLISSAVAFSWAIGGMFAITLGLAALCWIAATYFTLKRRMTLPSIVLVCGYSIGIGGFLVWMIETLGLPETGWVMVVLGLLGLAAMVGHYRAFRVPFSMFIAGLYGLSIVLGVTDMIGAQDLSLWKTETLFDLRQGNAVAMATLVFGLLTFSAAIWFDMRDPHRVGRLARTAFWLHLLAAPALVNTVMMTAYNIEGGLGMILTFVGLSLITLFALVIDRRSFLTAGLGYLGAVIFTLLQNGDGDLSIPTLMLILGVIVTYLGTFWTNLRVRVMRALPAFPFKDRLPPYSELS